MFCTRKNHVKVNGCECLARFCLINPQTGEEMSRLNIDECNEVLDLSHKGNTTGLLEYINEKIAQAKLEAYDNITNICKGDIKIHDDFAPNCYQVNDVLRVVINKIEELKKSK